jgi:hypothetical protein
MAFNLIRNARVFFTTNVDSATGVVNTTGFTTANTREIQVMDNLSFSQNTTSETVTLNEAGAAPVRGQRSFNTALDPVEFTFSTYIRPDFVNNGTTDTISAEESVLWGALSSTDGTGWTETAGDGTAAYSTANFDGSNAHQLQKFGMIIILDNSSYAIDNCVLDQASIDFGLDAIAMIAWTGRGSALRAISATATTADPVVLGGSLSGNALAKNTTAPYIANKLSTVLLVSNIDGVAGTTYSVPITGGNLTIANNVTYLTPANLGVVNQPVTYFTGTRAISGNITAYLRTGAGETAGLLDDLLQGSATDVDPAFSLTLAIGGSANDTRVELDMPACVLTIPTVSTDQVVSTTINFTAQGYTGGAFDLEETNELTVTYKSAVSA